MATYNQAQDAIDAAYNKNTDVSYKRSEAYNQLAAFNYDTFVTAWSVYSLLIPPAAILTPAIYVLIAADLATLAGHKDEYEAKFTASVNEQTNGIAPYLDAQNLRDEGYAFEQGSNPTSAEAKYNQAIIAANSALAIWTSAYGLAHQAYQAVGAVDGKMQSMADTSYYPANPGRP
jgi:hypothetical protein